MAKSGRYLSRVRMMRMQFLLIVIAGLTSGCLPKSSFAPAPENWEIWVKPGVGGLLLWKDMLECGYLEPYSSARVEREGHTFDKQVASMICVERLGYSYREGRRTKPVCSAYGWRDSRSCLPDAYIPAPEQQRRLNGPYCRKYPDAAACIP